MYLHNVSLVSSSSSPSLKSADQCMNNFLDSARQLEVFFLKKRLLLCRDKPENILKEEIENIEAEIERKNQVVAKHKERLASWQQKLADVGKAKSETTTATSTTTTTNNTTASIASGPSAGSTATTTTTSQAASTSGMFDKLAAYYSARKTSMF